MQDLGAGQFRISNDLTTLTAPGLWAQSRKLFPPVRAAVINIDISQVSQADSGGLALLVAWSRWANFQGKKFYLHGESEQLTVLIKNNQLEKLFYAA